ncbi:hypothetical protein CLOM621_07823 [Clostridium sp. M62/1]|nr:hypothetical protein CLOM621_07823 [Clostridium sp. M62/1]
MAGAGAFVFFLRRQALFLFSPVCVPLFNLCAHLFFFLYGTAV